MTKDDWISLQLAPVGAVVSVSEGAVLIFDIIEGDEDEDECDEQLGRRYLLFASDADARMAYSIAIEMRATRREPGAAKETQTSLGGVKDE